MENISSIIRRYKQPIFVILMILLIVFVIISQIRQLPSISRASFSFIYPTNAVISDTGTTHLIFRHTKFGSGYQYSDTDYNTYLHGNNSWDLPIQISSNPTSLTILHVHPAKNGFTIYYTYHGANSLLKREFNEFIGWGGEKILFGIDEASTILQSSSDNFERVFIRDFFFEDIESFIVIWSASLTSNTNKSYFPTLLSRKSKGVISYNHDFYSLGLPYNPAYFNDFPYPYSGGRCGSFVTTNETLLYHYDYYYMKRISLFKNGSVTGWTDSEFLDYMGYIPFAIDLIDNRFLLYQLEWDNVTELLTLAIRDLGSKEIAMKEFSLAINHSSLSDFSLDAVLAFQTDTHVNFTIAIRTADFIQLWNYDLTTNQTTKISELQWETSSDNQPYSSSSYSKILLLNDPPFWRLFCPVMTNLNIREIFHISFDEINGVWSISQIQIQNIL